MRQGNSGNSIVVNVGIDNRTRIGSLIAGLEMRLETEAVKLMAEANCLNLSARLKPEGGAAFLGFSHKVNGENRYVIAAAVKMIDGSVSHCAYIAPPDTTPAEMAFITQCLCTEICQINGVHGTPDISVEDATPTTNN